jgi:toxin ParE1/3/4
MSATYTIHQQALDDLEEIWLYSVQQWSLTQADKYILALFERFTWLAENPFFGKRRDDIKAGYYCFAEGKHLIFYKIADADVEIIGIPHQRMDIVNYFSQN